MKRLSGCLLMGVFIALSIIMWRTTDGILATWIDPSPWYRGFLEDHIFKWRLIFEALFAVFLLAPGTILIHRSLRAWTPADDWNFARHK